MIIAGNSNVNTFKQQGMAASAGSESVSVLWVGALTSHDFFSGHPAGQKVRELFAGHEGWKFLSMGTHDIYDLCHAASQWRLTESFAATRERFTRALRELKGDGKTGWIVFPQPTGEIRFAGIDPKEILSIANNFNSQIEQWCHSEGIAVVNPLRHILGSDGEPLPHFLQKDRIHVNSDAAELYLAEISRITGVTLEFRKNAPVFEPLNEPESYCSLLLGTLDLPFDRGLSTEALQEKLVLFVTELLKGKGLELDIDPQTELVDSGLLDSLNLVETYTHAVNAIAMEIDFDVDLRSLDTVEKICRFLEQRKALAGALQGPTFSDFITSLRGDIEDPAQRALVLEADHRIATLDPERVNSFTEQFYIVSGNYNCNYGIIYFWLSLWAAAKGECQTALELLNHGSGARIAHPFKGPHVQYYLDKWIGIAELLGITIPTGVGPESPVDAAGTAVTATPAAPIVTATPAAPIVTATPAAPIVTATPAASIVTATPVAPIVAAVAAAPAAPVEPARSRPEKPALAAATPLPRISLVIPSYNYARYLEACLDSILSQNYPNLELIIMDGGSTDGSAGIIRRHEKHLAYWQSQPDAGQYSAIEEGFRRSTGEIMAWLNADDMFHPGAFSTVSGIFCEQPSVEWLMGRPNSFDEEGKQKHVLTFLPMNSRAKYLADQDLIQQEGIFWRRGLWERSGAYIEKSLLLAADLELWARFFRSAELHAVNTLIAGFRDHPLQKSKDKAAYTAEADRVLAREREIFAAERRRFCPPAPLPILVEQYGVAL